MGHPDVSTGSGVDIAATAAVGGTPTMSTLAAAMQGSPGFYTRELLKDSDIVVVALSYTTNPCPVPDTCVIVIFPVVDECEQLYLAPTGTSTASILAWICDARALAL